jgi:glycosyltransferase involved in cell wall biosynthesis
LTAPLLKIAIVTEDFLPFLGGQEVRYYELGQELCKNGHHVDLYTMRVYAGTRSTEVFSGVNVYRITNAPHYKHSWWGARNPIDILRFTFSLIRRRSYLEMYDVVIFNIWPVVPAAFLPRLLKTKSVIDWCEIRLSFFWNIVYWFLANKNVLHIGVNEDICNYLINTFHIANSKVMPILSGTKEPSENSKNIPRQNKLILFFGRMTEHKDPEILLSSYVGHNLADEGFVLQFAGEGELLDKLKTKYQTATGVTFYGRVSEEKKNELLASATVLVLPSKREGFPRVIAEAAVVGTPTITTNSPGNGGRTVVLRYGLGRVCEHSPLAIANVLRNFADVKNPDWQSVSNHCRSIATRDFSWSTVSNKLLRFLVE